MKKTIWHSIQCFSCDGSGIEDYNCKATIGGTHCEHRSCPMCKGKKFILVPEDSLEKWR